MTEPYPPQILQGDPEALYGKPNAPGNGPVILNQASPIATGDTIVRNANGYWENTASGVGIVPGNATVGGTLTVTGHVGFNGQTAVGKSSAYTLTYSTEARTVPAATAAAVVTTEPTETKPFGYTKAQAEAIIAAANANAADILAVKKLVVALIKDLEAVGIAG